MITSITTREYTPNTHHYSCAPLYEHKVLKSAIKQGILSTLIRWYDCQNKVDSESSLGCYLEVSLIVIIKGRLESKVVQRRAVRYSKFTQLDNWCPERNWSTLFFWYCLVPRILSRLFPFQSRNSIHSLRRFSRFHLHGCYYARTLPVIGSDGWDYSLLNSKP